MKQVHILFLVISFLHSTTGQKSACKEQLDLVLVIQVPERENMVASILKFLTNLKSNLVEKNPCYQMATVVAARVPRLLIGLRCGYGDNARCYKVGVARLRRELSVRTPRQSNLGNAIDFLSSAVYRGRSGARKDAKRKVVLLLTSPPNNDTMAPKDAVKELHDFGTSVVAIAVGKEANYDLRKITLSDVGRFRVEEKERLSTPEFAAILSDVLKGTAPPLRQVAKFSSVSAPAPQLRLKEVDYSEQCEYFADVGFLIDSSGSVRDDYDKEKFFVRRMATKFNISEEGSHAGAIIFSSKGYVTLSIKLNQYTRLQDFNDAVDKLYFYGYQTRIDLALKMANDDMFNVKNGMRPKLKNVLVLITDGRQNPIVDSVSGAIYDPAVTADALHKRNIQLFAIGIGQRINVTELERITRDKSRVYNVNNFDELISDDFVKKVSAKLCQPGQLVPENATDATFTSPIPTTSAPCTKSCCESTTKTCCDRGPVYINIFNGQYTTVVQGFGKEHMENISKVLPFGISAVKADPQKRLELLIQTLFPDRNDLMKVLQTMITLTTRPPPATKSSDIVINRKKRSIAETYWNISETGRAVMKTYQSAMAIVEGWSRFFRLFENEIMVKLLQSYVEKNVSLLALSDEAFTKAKIGTKAFERKLQAQGLGMYLIKSLDVYGMYWKPLERNIVLRAYMDVSSEEEEGSLFIENSRILSKQLPSAKVPVVLLDSVLIPPKDPILSIMERMPTLSMFTDFVKRSGILNIMANPPVVSEFCLTAKTCMKMSEEMLTRLQVLAKTKQLTIFAPSNEAILKVKKSKLKELLRSPEKLREQVGSHVVIGTVFSRSVNSKIASMSPSLSEKNKIFMLTKTPKLSPLRYSDYHKTKVAEVQETDIRGTDAVLHVVDTFFAA